MSLKDFFKRLMGTKEHPAHLPYIPTPPSQQPNIPFNQFPHNHSDADLSYTESEISIHAISGTSIGFGTQKVVQVDSRGQAKDLSQSQSHIVGTGRIVSKVEDIAGVCPFCQIEAKEAFDKGLLSFQEAQSKSLYDKQSASQCDICGVNTCSRHCRPILMPDGVTQRLCSTCQKQLKGQIIKQKIIGFLFSPFIEESQEE